MTSARSIAFVRRRARRWTAALGLVGWLGACGTASTSAGGVLVRVRVPDEAVYRVVSETEDTRWDGAVDHMLVTSQSRYQRIDGRLYSTWRILDASGDELSDESRANLRGIGPRIRPSGPSIDELNGRDGSFPTILLMGGEVPFPPDPVRRGDRYVVQGTSVRVGPASTGAAAIACEVLAASVDEVTLGCATEYESEVSDLVFAYAVRVVATIRTSDGVTGHRVVERTTRQSESGSTETSRIELRVERVIERPTQ